MKRIIIVLSVLGTFLLPSCSDLLAPTHAEDESVLINVYDETLRLQLGLKNWSIGERFIAAICGIQEASRSEKINSVEMLDWCFNEQMQGDSYTGYFITYKVTMGEKTCYTLLDLTEFDSGGCEWKVIDSDRSLSTIQSELY